MAGILGCTTEFRKWEGITYDAKNKKLYTAISEIEYGMEDNQKNGVSNTQYDLGTGNHIRVADNQCGCVMEMDVDDHMVATKARMLTCGVPNSDRTADDQERWRASFGGTQKCIVDHIANPDNVAMIPDYNQLIIGEDTSSHDNNLIWIYDLYTGAMTRVASTPVGAETTSPYWYTVGDWSYMSYIVQHPGSSVTGTAGYIGYVGPIPTKAGMGWHKPEAVWEEMSYPNGSEVHNVRTSSMVQLNHDHLGNTKIGYTTLYRSSDTNGDSPMACALLSSTCSFAFWATFIHVAQDAMKSENSIILRMTGERCRRARRRTYRGPVWPADQGLHHFRRQGLGKSLSPVQIHIRLVEFGCVKALKVWLEQNDVISNNPDFHSILRRDGKIFSVTHFESPRPGVAYLAEYVQHEDGKLTVSLLRVTAIRAKIYMRFTHFWPCRRLDGSRSTSPPTAVSGSRARAP